MEREFSLGIRDRPPIKRIASVLVATLDRLDAVATDDGARDGPPRGVHHSPEDPLLRHGDRKRRLHFHQDRPASGIDFVEELRPTTRPVYQHLESQARIQRLDPEPAFGVRRGGLPTIRRARRTDGARPIGQGCRKQRHRDPGHRTSPGSHLAHQGRPSNPGRKVRAVRIHGPAGLRRCLRPGAEHPADQHQPTGQSTETERPIEKPPRHTNVQHCSGFLTTVLANSSTPRDLSAWLNPDDTTLMKLAKTGIIGATKEALCGILHDYFLCSIQLIHPACGTVKSEASFDQLGPQRQAPLDPPSPVAGRRTVQSLPAPAL